MGKYKEIACDICGKNCIGKEGLIKIKVKRFWVSFHECGWVREPIYICPDCISNIKKRDTDIRFLRNDIHFLGNIIMPEEEQK